MKTLDQIHQRLDALARADAANHAERLALIAEADAMQAPFIDGARDLSEWIARHLDEHPHRASQLARTARAISDEVANGLRSGDLSIARAEAYAAAEIRGIDTADLDGLDITSVWRRVRRRTPVQGPVGRYFVLQPSLDLEHWRAHGRLGAVDGALVADALTAEADRVVTGIPGRDRGSRSERMADALVSLTIGDAKVTHNVVVHVATDSEIPSTLPTVGLETTGGVAVTPSELDEALCSARLAAAAVTTAGRKARRPRLRKNLSTRTRRHIEYRDHHVCAIDGCSSRHRLEIHHILPVSAGGSNAPENLMLACWYHHHVVIHRRGFRVDPTSPSGRRRLIGSNSRSP